MLNMVKQEIPIISSRLYLHPVISKAPVLQSVVAAALRLGCCSVPICVQDPLKEYISECLVQLPYSPERPPKGYKCYSKLKQNTYLNVNTRHTKQWPWEFLASGPSRCQGSHIKYLSAIKNFTTEGIPASSNYKDLKPEYRITY